MAIESGSLTEGMMAFHPTLSVCGKPNFSGCTTYPNSQCPSRAHVVMLLLVVQDSSTIAQTGEWLFLAATCGIGNNGHCLQPDTPGSSRRSMEQMRTTDLVLQLDSSTQVHNIIYTAFLWLCCYPLVTILNLGLVSSAVSVQAVIKKPQLCGALGRMKVEFLEHKYT